MSLKLTIVILKFLFKKYKHYILTLLFIIFHNEAISKNYQNLFIGDSNINYADIEILFKDINATHISKYGGDTSIIIDDLERINLYITPDIKNIFLMVCTNDIINNDLIFQKYLHNLEKIFFI